MLQRPKPRNKANPERKSRMAKGVNKVILLGYVGKDPEIRSTQSGTIVANISLATNEKVKQGEDWVDKTEWHSLVAFKRTAEIVRDYVKKGSQIHVEGKLQTRSWDDKDSGQKKYRTEIIINDLVLLGGQGKENGNGSSQSSPSYSSANGRKSGGYANSGSGYEQQNDYGDVGITDDDLPPF
jgi:single-strand DNA-binding protein